MIESDSANAVKWIICPNTTPWKLRKFWAAIEYAVSEITNWLILHGPRNAMKLRTA
ncbi:hypothetical protein REPUB_Repub11eG0173600 [Reevesia pubescens]